MRFDDFMGISNCNGSTGYYDECNQIGSLGDFITAPEISDHFGQSIGNLIYMNWMNNSNVPLELIELGPGNGSLMLSIVRKVGELMSKSNYDLNIASITMIERGENLRKRQRDRLSVVLAPQSLRWYNDLNEYKKASFLGGETFKVVIANEFFDAIPIRHYQVRFVHTQRVL